MHIIKTVSDICKLKESHIITDSLANHLEKKIIALNVVLEADVDLGLFSLDHYGPIGVLEASDKNLNAIGLAETLVEIMPEWISRLVIVDEVYYILYVMADNDYVIQVYMPDSILTETFRDWLAEQTIEEEGEENYDQPEQHHPF